MTPPKLDAEVGQASNLHPSLRPLYEGLPGRYKIVDYFTIEEIPQEPDDSETIELYDDDYEEFLAWRAAQGKKTWPCRVCDEELPTPQALGGHVTKHVATGQKKRGPKPKPRDPRAKDGGGQGTRRPHLCEQCGLTFRTPKALGGHMKVHTPGHYGTQVCDICEREFPTRQGLAGHRWNAHGLRKGETLPPLADGVEEPPKPTPPPVRPVDPVDRAGSTFEKTIAGTNDAVKLSGLSATDLVAALTMGLPEGVYVGYDTETLDLYGVQPGELRQIILDPRYVVLDTSRLQGDVPLVRFGKGDTYAVVAWPEPREMGRILSVVVDEKQSPARVRAAHATVAPDRPRPWPHTGAEVCGRLRDLGLIVGPLETAEGGRQGWPVSRGEDHLGHLWADAKSPEELERGWSHFVALAR